MPAPTTPAVDRATRTQSECGLFTAVPRAAAVVTHDLPSVAGSTFDCKASEAAYQTHPLHVVRLTTPAYRSQLTAYRALLLHQQKVRDQFIVPVLDKEAGAPVTTDDRKIAASL